MFYDEADVRVLRELLSQPEQEQFHRTIVTLIGLISDGSIEDILAIDEYSATLNADIGAAMMALGYIAHLTGEVIATDILLERFADADPSVADAGTLGLILAGSDDAFDALTAKLDSERDPASRDRLIRAIEENQRIAELGLHEHYENPPEFKPVDPSFINRGEVFPDELALVE